MEISRKDWLLYAKRLGRISRTASGMMEEFIRTNGSEDLEALTEYAFALVTKYGEASASFACEMYDALAKAQGAKVPAAVPAQTAPFWETRKAMTGTTDAERPGAVDRLVKRAAADTTMQNAVRDRAQFAWIPSGDSCAFCMALASRGWRNISKKALKNGHAEHIHAHCDCQYTIRFDKTSTVEGYEPERYQEMYDAAEGNTPQEKINAMRRGIEAEKKELKDKAGGDNIITGAISGALDPTSDRAQEHAERYYAAVRKMRTDCIRIADNTGFSLEDIESIKDYVFTAKHDLGEDIEELFAPSYEMAESWRRLIDGRNIQPHDITLLHHEKMEKDMVEKGLSQAEAHLRTSQIYDYASEAQRYYDQINEHKKK